MLEVRGLTVRYGAILAVDKIDLQVDTGRCIGLLGANGAGKSSTLRALSGLVPSEGEIRFDGEVLHDRHADVIARKGLIHVPEGRHVVPTLSVHENLLVGETARGKRTATFGIDDVYDLFPLLAPLRDRSGWMLSGGEQQMVAVGRALVAGPKLLMLDEPSLGLAPIVIEAMFGAFQQICERTSVLLVEQNTALALDICSHAQVMNGGRVVMAGPAAELRSRRDLVDSFLGTNVHGAEGAPSGAARPPTGGSGIDATSSSKGRVLEQGAP